jgi:hypothetical protein
MKRPTSLYLLLSGVILYGCNCGNSTEQVSTPIVLDAGEGCMTTETAKKKFGMYADLVVQMQPPAHIAQPCQYWTFDQAPGIDALEHVCTTDWTDTMGCEYKQGKACYHLVSDDLHCDYGWFRLRD